jgi:thiol-disulfide isomerase/thioredoxin
VQESPRHRLARYAIVAAIVLVLGGLFARQQWERLRGPETAEEAVRAAQVAIGAPAPEVSLDTVDGHVRLSELRGKVVVLNFWATWCVPCRAEMPELQALHAARGGDVVVVGVNATSLESRDGAIGFARDLGIRFPVVFDVNGVATRAYGVQGLPATFFIDRAGVVRARALGPQTAETLAQNVREAGG